MDRYETLEEALRFWEATDENYSFRNLSNDCKKYKGITHSDDLTVEEIKDILWEIKREIESSY
ncbi:MAG: hypothetical protein MRY83_01930 [Flavobacteriales bacterium]|nr:hypothetical protein [Flavobacteriales bacterium]